MHIEMLGSGWSNGFRVHASLYKIVEDGEIVFRMNIENSLTGKFARREYTDRQTAERDMSDILFKDGMSLDGWNWH